MMKRKLITLSRYVRGKFDLFRFNFVVFAPVATQTPRPNAAEIRERVPPLMLLKCDNYDFGSCIGKKEKPKMKQNEIN